MRGEHGFDDFIPQQNQCGHHPQTFGQGFVATRARAFLNHRFAPQFLDVVGGLAGPVGALRQTAKRANFTCYFTRRETLGGSR